MNTGTLLTIGYTEDNAKERIEAFLAQPRTGLVDIRYTPRCRWNAQWNKSALQAKYGRAKYVHEPCFGNVNYRKKDGPIQLANPDERLPAVVNFLIGGASLMLLCACKEYERCHRRTVYELVMSTVNARLAELEALQARPTMQYNEQRDCFAVQMPNGRLLCTTTENFLQASSSMPLASLDNPEHWLGCVDGKTVWIEVQP